MTDRDSMDRERASREARDAVVGRPLSRGVTRTQEALRRYLGAEALWLHQRRRDRDAGTAEESGESGREDTR